MTEAQLHRAVAAFLRVALKPPTIWTTIGHGGGGRVRGAQLKAMGVQKGWPDILVIDDGLAIGIELKAKKGAQSPEQKALEVSFVKAGMTYWLCRSVEDVEAALRTDNVPIHATVMGSGAKVAA